MLPTFRFLPLAFAAVAFLPYPARAQAPPPGNYTYTLYTVLDRTNPGPDSLTFMFNVSGTLHLSADGTYQKNLSIVFPAGPRYFNQTGRFSFAAPDSIFFAFTDARGPDVQRGTCRYDPATSDLAIRLAGYPPGNEGRYLLVESRHFDVLRQEAQQKAEQMPACGGSAVRYREEPPHDLDEERVSRPAPPKVRPKNPLKPTKPRPRR